MGCNRNSISKNNNNNKTVAVNIFYISYDKLKLSALCVNQSTHRQNLRPSLKPIQNLTLKTASLAKTYLIHKTTRIFKFPYKQIVPGNFYQVLSTAAGTPEQRWGMGAVKKLRARKLTKNKQIITNMFLSVQQQY